MSHKSMSLSSNFYPRPPGGGRHPICTKNQMHHYISIHALRVEGDRRFHDVKHQIVLFLSTPSGWRATISFADRLGKIDISIHALRVEGDSKNGQSFQLFLRKREKNLPL